jgi:hypothetical protein
VEAEAARELVDALGADMMTIASELEKLLLYTLGHGKITLGDVETMVLSAKQRSLYELTDAISARNRVKALALLQGLLNSTNRPYADRSASSRPSAPRSYSDRPASDRPRPSRPSFDRPAPSGRPSFSPRPDRPTGDRPSRPSFSRPEGGRPSYTSSGQPRPGGARPSSKPGKFGKPTGSKPYKPRTEGGFSKPASSTRPKPRPGSSAKPSHRVKPGGKSSGKKRNY